MIFFHGSISNRILLREVQADVARVIHPTSLSNITIIDRVPDNEAHQDAIQIIPTGNAPRQQFAAALLTGIRMRNISIYSEGQLQGIFCSDGLLDDVSIRDTMINTKSAHKITLNGLLSGEFRNISNGIGDVIKPVLNPLRIGGGNNVWILEFSSEKYRYRHVHGEIIDNRKKPQRGINMVDFDLDSFRTAVSLIDQKEPFYAKTVSELAVRFGRIIT